MTGRIRINKEIISWAARQVNKVKSLSSSGPGFDPRSGQVSWVRFFRGFSSPVRQMSGSLRPQGPRISFGPHCHQSSFITGANELRCWRALKSQIYIRRRSERRVGEWTVTYVKQRKGWRMSCDEGKATKALENELRRRWSDGTVGEWAELIIFMPLAWAARQVN